MTAPKSGLPLAPTCGHDGDSDLLTTPAELTFDLSPSGSADGARAWGLADAGMDLADVTIVGAKAHAWEALADRMEDDDSMTTPDPTNQGSRRACAQAAAPQGDGSAMSLREPRRPPRA